MPAECKPTLEQLENEQPGTRKFRARVCGRIRRAQTLSKETGCGELAREWENLLRKMYSNRRTMKDAWHGRASSEAGQNAIKWLLKKLPRRTEAIERRAEDCEEARRRRLGSE